jgi:hypothetical protein
VAIAGNLEGHLITHHQGWRWIMKRHTTGRIPLDHESAGGVPDTSAESEQVKVPTPGQSKPTRPQGATTPVIRANTVSLGTSQKGQVRVAFFDCE